MNHILHTTYHVLDLAELDRIRAWVMTPNSHAQLIDQVLGSQQAWLVTVTDHPELGTRVADRAEKFRLQFASAVKEHEHA
jgi:CTP synthase (UTP-ammonia lyase)